MRLDEGWNQIQFNLSDFTRRAYGTNYIETLRVQIHANCRIRRIYFSDRLYSGRATPEFKLFLPIQRKVAQMIRLLKNHRNKHSNNRRNETGQQAVKCRIAKEKKILIGYGPVDFHAGDG